ncbi:hypothetical protein AB0442_03390 [Kitasatospora sp. NPDC085895]|uniref:hypothetical protein n=1 Tax=Kitasatospora sp. NPDC085895 TaxID=3155057 RepID=UPI00344FBCED
MESRPQHQVLAGEAHHPLVLRLHLGRRVGVAVLDHRGLAAAQRQVEEELGGGEALLAGRRAPPAEPASHQVGDAGRAVGGGVGAGEQDQPVGAVVQGAEDLQHVDALLLALFPDVDVDPGVEVLQAGVVPRVEVGEDAADLGVAEGAGVVDRSGYVVDPAAAGAPRSEQHDQGVRSQRQHLLQRPDDGERFGAFGPAAAALPVAQAGDADLQSAAGQSALDPFEAESALADGRAQREVEGPRAQRVEEFGRRCRGGLPGG